MTALLVVLVFVALYAGFVYLVMRWARGLRTRRAQAVASALAGAGATIVAVRPPTGMKGSATIDLTLGGRSAVFEIRPYLRDWYLLSIAVPSAPLPYVLIRPERAADQLGKRMGFNREVQVGDAAFDAAAFIDTAERDDVVRRLLERPEVRAAVLAILATGYHVEMSPDGLRASRLQMKMAPIATGTLPAAIAALEALAPLLPALPPTSFARPHWFRSRSMVFGALAIAVIGFAAAGAAGAAVHPVAVQRDILSGFAVGFALWGAVVAALFFLLRGGTHSIKQFFLAAFLLLLGVPTAGTMLVFLANSALDGSPAVTHHVTVIAVPKPSTGKKKRNNQVTFTSWRPDHDQLVIGVPYAHLGNLKVGDAVDITTHAGAFGWEWVAEVR
jgi:hypothetical protein